METKSFDCVEMKQRGAKQLSKRLQGMSREEELQFWHAQTEDLRSLQREEQRRSAAICDTGP